jgi:hypothetical protein
MFRTYSVENVRVYVNGVPVGNPLSFEFQDPFPSESPGFQEPWSVDVPMTGFVREEFRCLMASLAFAEQRAAPDVANQTRRAQCGALFEPLGPIVTDITDKPPESPHTSASSPPADSPRTAR